MTTAFKSIGGIDSEALRAARIVEGVVGNAWATDASGKFIYVTPSALTLLGTTLEELNSPSEEGAVGWKRLIHPDDYGGAVTMWRHCLQTGDHYNMEHRILRASGAYGWSRSSGQPSRDSTGRILAWYGALIDGDVPSAAKEQFADVISDALETKAVSDAPHSLSLVHPDDRTAAAHAAARAFWTGVPQVTRHRQLQADGSYRWNETRSEPGYSVSVDIDDLVTDREPRTSAGLDPSVENEAEPIRSAKIVESLFGNGWAFDAAGRWIYLHPFAQNSLGVTLEDLNASLDEGHTAWKRLLHPDDYGPIAATWRHCLETGDHFNVEFRFRRANGIYVWARTAARPARDSHGRIAGWYGIALDNDVYKKTVTALRGRERELSQLVDMVPVQIRRLTPEGEPTFFNKRLLDFFGLNEVAQLDKPGMSRLAAAIQSLVHPEDAARLLETLHHSLATGEPYSMKYRMRRADGAYRWVDGRWEPLRDHSGSIVHWYAISIDIDGEVKAQEALRLAQERLARASQAASLAELSASIAHEVNQPLAAVVANSHACQRWLTAEPPNIERAQKTVERIIRDANSAADVVSRIRALFRPSVETRTSTTLDNVIAEALDLLAEESARRRARMDVDVESDLPLVVLDRVQIQQVLVNLIRNALDAMDSVADDKILGVRVRRVGDVVQTEISDRGPGIEFPERIFEPFFTTKTHGMGMGLAICRSIVASHGGQLWMKQNEPHGATFIFTLPIEAKAAP